MEFSLGQCAEWASGELVGDWDLKFKYIVADSRLCKPESLFVAIPGPNYDGADFVQDAANKGAVAAIVSDKESLHGLPGIVCEDPISAIGMMAKKFRESTDIPWIAVTGSNGKTTTRELLACILKSKGNIVSSCRNYNNRIGVPLSILSAPEDAWAGVIELGTNAPGEIAELAEILRPDIAIITSIGASHLQGLKSVQGVAEEKAGIFDFLSENGLAVYPSNCQYRGVIDAKNLVRKKTFAMEGNADIVPSDIVCTEDNVSFSAWYTDFNVPVSGRHNINNIMAAIVTADSLGVTPVESAEALKKFKRVSGRLTIKKSGDITIIDDTYNSNPDSMCAAVKFLCDIPAKRRVCILGYMGELGSDSEKLHRECGYLIARSGVDLLLTMGQDTVTLAESASTRSVGCKVHYFPSVTAVLPKLSDFIQPGDTILVKGSRKAKMERIVNILMNIYDDNDGSKNSEGSLRHGVNNA